MFPPSPSFLHILISSPYFISSLGVVFKVFLGLFRKEILHFMSFISGEKSSGLQTPFPVRNPSTHFWWEICPSFPWEISLFLVRNPSICILVLFYIVFLWEIHLPFRAALKVCEEGVELGRRCWRPIYGGIDDF